MNTAFALNENGSTPYLQAGNYDFFSEGKQSSLFKFNIKQDGKSRQPCRRCGGDEDGEEAEEGRLLRNPWPPESRGGLSRMALPAFTDS